MTLANGNLAARADLVVVGGGLAGLTAAALVARAGRSVVVLEQAGTLGGRAATRVREGVHFNVGAHALYCRGQAHRTFTELGVPFSGHFPSPGRSLLLKKGVSYRMPQGLPSLLTSRLLTVREKWRMAGLLAGIQRIDAAGLDRATVSDWTRQVAGTGNLAQFLLTLFRLTTYVNDPDRLSAGAAIRQLQMALGGNVLYLDGGWQTLVDGLRAKAAEQGADVRTGARVAAVRMDAEGVTVQLAGKDAIHGRSVVLAVPPATVAELLDLPADGPLASRLRACIPVRAAALDVAFRHAGQPATRFALGLDLPLYYSVHSAAATLAPAGVAVVQLMKYLGNDTAPAEVAEREMETLLRQLLPDWQKTIVARQLLPAMVVTHDVPLAATDGLAGRVSVAVPEMPGVFLAGDWVGAEGMLADASAASGAEAARCVLATRPGVARSERSPAHVHH